MFWRRLLATGMAAKLTPKPLGSLRVSSHYIPKYQHTPSTSIQNKPLLIYHSAFPPQDVSASTIEAHVTSLHVVEPMWRYTMYRQSHFHSNTHEVLCIASGRAVCCFGHEDNPGRVEIELSKGDVVVIPAGVSHRLVRDVDGGFQMVGSYPLGKSWDMCYGQEDEAERVEGIASLGWFSRDPIYGETGPVLDF